MYRNATIAFCLIMLIAIIYGQLSNAQDVVVTSISTPPATQSTPRFTQTRIKNYGIVTVVLIDHHTQTACYRPIYNEFDTRATWSCVPLPSRR